MKTLRKIIVWSIIGLVIESCFFIYFDKNNFASDLKLKDEVIDEKKQNKSVAVNIPQSAKNIKVSSNGKFVSYFSGGIFNVANMETGSTNSIRPSGNNAMCYCKWVDDDSVIIAEKNGVYFLFYAYNASKNQKKQIVDYTPKNLKLRQISRNDTVDNIAFSTVNHTMYIKVLRASRSSDIYRINVMNQVDGRVVMGNVGNIDMLWQSTNLIYEDRVHGMIKATGQKVATVISRSKNSVLLGTDNKDRIFIGQKQNNKVIGITYGNLSIKLAAWSHVSLTKSANLGDVYISKAGNIYTINPQSRTVNDITSNSETQYAGTFIGIFDGGILSVNNGKTVKTELK